MAVHTEYTGVSQDKLSLANKTINGFSTELFNVESKILNDLDGLKKALLVDNQSIDNGIDDITANFKSFKSSYTGVTALFSNLSTKYDESSIAAGKYMENKFNEVDR